MTLYSNSEGWRCAECECLIGYSAIYCNNCAYQEGTEMPLSIEQKAMRAENALNVLRNELYGERQARQGYAITEFLNAAGIETKARLFDLVTEHESKPDVR